MKNKNIKKKISIRYVYSTHLYIRYMHIYDDEDDVNHPVNGVRVACLCVCVCVYIYRERVYISRSMEQHSRVRCILLKRKC